MSFSDAEGYGLKISALGASHLEGGAYPFLRSARWAERTHGAPVPSNRIGRGESRAVRCPTRRTVRSAAGALAPLVGNSVCAHNRGDQIARRA